MMKKFLAAFFFAAVMAAMPKIADAAGNLDNENGWTNLRYKSDNQYYYLHSDVRPIKHGEGLIYSLLELRVTFYDDYDEVYEIWLDPANKRYAVVSKLKYHSRYGANGQGASQPYRENWVYYAVDERGIPTDEEIRLLCSHVAKLRKSEVLP